MVADVAFANRMMSRQPQVLILVRFYSPGYKAGGPTRSIENLVAAFSGEFQFRIVTLDRDIGDKVPFVGIVANRWVRVGHADVMYLRPGLQGLIRLWAVLGSSDRNTVLYLNSFFERRFSMLACFLCWLKICRPRSTVIAPRGEFSSGALQLHRGRKLLYIRLSRWLGLYKDVIWQACSDFEAEEVRRQFPLAKRIDSALFRLGPDPNRIPRTSVVVTASNIARVSSGAGGRPAKRPGQLRAVFVSRFSRMKNLSGALKILAGVTGNVSFDIYGPAEDAKYWEECRRLIALLPENILVRCRGAIKHEEVKEVFAESDLFLFPTHGESYGHVICEALASGCPVLISDQTPWRGLEEEGVGWDIPLAETERFQSILQQCVDGDDRWFSAMSCRAIAYATKHASDPAIIDANRKLFQWAFSWPDVR